MRNKLLGRIVLIPVALLLLILGACGGAYGPANDVAYGPGGEEESADDARKIVRTTDLGLAIKDLDPALSALRSIAHEAGGFVSDSNVVVTNADDPEVARPQRAELTLRVPAGRYDAVMDQLRSVAAGVDSETTSTTEVTDEYTDLQSRLRNLQAAQASYVALLAKASSIDEVLRVQDQINATQGDIEQAQGRLNVLNDETGLATIHVALRLVTAPAGEVNWAVQAWQTSFGASEALLVVLGTLAIAGFFAGLWVLPPLVAGYLVWRRFGGRIVSFARRLN